MTWWREPETSDSYGIFFNRDEKKTRPRAHLPTIRENTFLAPQDPQGGGTWLAVNQTGIIVALLNHWHLEKNKKYTQSRGQLVWMLAAIKSISDIELKLQGLNMPDYPPFILILMDQHDIKRIEWNGKELKEHPVQGMSCSSSFDYENVKTRRETKYSHLSNSKPSTLRSFHTEDSEGAYSVRMLRPDAQTWSRSEITISSTEVQWTYHEEFLDFETPSETTDYSLPLIPYSS